MTNLTSKKQPYLVLITQSQVPKNMEESDGQILPEDYSPKNKYYMDDKSIARNSNPMTESRYT